MKSPTDVFAQKNFPKDIFNSKICYRYDYLVIGRVEYNSESNRARNFKSYSSGFEITRAITP